MMISKVRDYTIAGGNENISLATAMEDGSRCASSGEAVKRGNR